METQIIDIHKMYVSSVTKLGLSKKNLGWD